MRIKRQKLFKKVSSESLLTGSIIAALIAVTPYAFYLYEGLPNVKVWKTFVFGYEFVYDSAFYQSINVVAWILIGKIIPLFLLLIWFLTCKHWWYHAILVPICMYIVQIFLTLKDDGQIIDDTSGILYMAPIILVMLIFLYQIRMKIFDRIHNIDFSELNRVSLKGEIKEKNKKDYPLEASYTPTMVREEEYDDYEEDGDNEPLYMG